MDYQKNGHGIQAAAPDYEPCSEPTLYFIGVTTSHSSIMKVFPLWAQELRHPEVRIVGIVLRLHDSPYAYRRVVQHIKSDPLALGALVTTHKIDLLAAARDLFDYLDPYAELCNEVSCISKSGDRLEGYAKDPLSAGATIDEMLECQSSSIAEPADVATGVRSGGTACAHVQLAAASPGSRYFVRTGGHVLCFGAGGAAVATVLHLAFRAEQGDRPARVIVVNRSRPRLEALQTMLAKVQTDLKVDYVLNEDPHRNDAIMAQLPEGSLVINATGMGKDRPGSPITDAALFPRYGIVWEMNYRGQLTFLHQAERQAATRALWIEDGWRYFLHGWAEVIAQVLHVEIGAPLLARLAKIAEPARGAAMASDTAATIPDERFSADVSADEQAT